MKDMTTVSSKGQIVIPKRMREKSGFLPGDRLAIEWDEGKLILTKVNTYNEKPSPSLVRELLGKYSTEAPEGSDRSASESVRSLRESLYGKITD